MVEKTVLKRKRSCTSHNLTIQNLNVKISSINYNLNSPLKHFPLNSFMYTNFEREIDNKNPICIFSFFLIIYIYYNNNFKLLKISHLAWYAIYRKVQMKLSALFLADHVSSDFFFFQNFHVNLFYIASLLKKMQAQD